MLLYPTTSYSNAAKKDFKITNIHYGTLITGAAMRNIYKKNSIVSNPVEYGIVAHRLMNCDYKTTFSFAIDVDKKKFEIAATVTLFQLDFMETTTILKFEWDFQEYESDFASRIFFDS